MADTTMKLNDDCYIIHNPKIKHLAIGGMIWIDLEDGSITHSVDYTPSKAAEEFWQAVSSEYVQFLKWKRSKFLG